MTFAERLLILSDLHLAPSGPLCNFHSGRELARLLDQEWNDSTLLVLNGDTLDLLLGPVRAETLSAREAPELLERHLDLLDRDAEARLVLDAWRRGALRGQRAIMLPGNHDLELFHPRAERVVRHALGVGEGTDSWQVLRSSEPLVLQVGTREVVLGHGHRSDPWNSFEPGAWPVDEKDAPRLPPGSLLVLRVFNAFKEVRNSDDSPSYPFLDGLKPEMPGVLLLLLRLDAARVRAHLPAAWRPLLSTIARAVRRRLLGGPSLGPSDPNPADTELEILASAVAAPLVETLSEAERQAPRATVQTVERALAGTESSAPGALGLGSDLLLFAAVHALAQGSDYFNPSALSAYDRALIEAQLPDDPSGRVVVCGHTHAARECRLSGNRSYFNSGTWTDLIRLPPLADRPAARDWERDLLAGRGGRIQRRTWVEIDARGAKLRGLES